MSIRPVVQDDPYLLTCSMVELRSVIEVKQENLNAIRESEKAVVSDLKYLWGLCKNREGAENDGK